MDAGLEADEGDPEGASSSDDEEDSPAAPSNSLKHSQSEPLESSTACVRGSAYSQLLIKAGWR